MNEKVIGGMIIAIMVVIVGIALFQSSAQAVGSTTGELDAIDLTYTAPAVNGVIELVGQELLSVPVVKSATGGEVIDAGNYTIYEGVSDSNTKRVLYRSSPTSGYAGLPINVSYTYGADGYISDAGSRSIGLVILVLFALGVAIVMLVPAMRSGVLDMISK